MPIIDCDVKSLEWVTYIYLAQDKVAIDEWNNVLDYPDKYDDIHTTNQKQFDLPTRLISKKLLFRAIYADPDKAAFAFSKDPEFMPTSKKVQYWQEALDKFFAKYKLLKRKHLEYIQQATTKGIITSPFGREYYFEPKTRNGERFWPIADILNWPNQGLGADVMSVVRIVTAHGARKRAIQGNMVNTVHDSIVWDAPVQSVPEIAKLMMDVFEHLPFYIKKYLGVDWNVRMTGEIGVGNNFKDLVDYKI